MNLEEYGMHTKRPVIFRAALPRRGTVTRMLSRVVRPRVMSLATTIVIDYGEPR